MPPSARTRDLMTTFSWARLVMASAARRTTEAPGGGPPPAGGGAVGAVAGEEGDEAREGARVGDGVLVLLLDREQAQDEAGLLLDVLAAVRVVVWDWQRERERKRGRKSELVKKKEKK